MGLEQFDADLFDAAEFGDLDWLKNAFLLSPTNYDVNMIDGNGETLLMFAAKYGHDISFLFLSIRAPKLL